MLQAHTNHIALSDGIQAYSCHGRLATQCSSAESGSAWDFIIIVVKAMVGIELHQYPRPQMHGVGTAERGNMCPNVH